MQLLVALPSIRLPCIGGAPSVVFGEKKSAGSLMDPGSMNSLF